MYFLGIDQGTSGTMVGAFDEHLQLRANAYRAIASDFSSPGRAEQNAAEILASVVDAVAEVLHALGGCKSIAAAGIANQGESVVAWDAPGEWVTPVVLWSDDRGTQIVESLQTRGRAARVRELTGLPLSPYFSAAKLSWLIQNDSRLQHAREKNALRLGTLDTYLAWHLNDHSYVTDHGTASRTQLLDLDTLQWNAELLEDFSLPLGAASNGFLPQLRPSLGDLGALHHPSWGGSLPWRASVVDQPAALAGNACFHPGETKITYGTGSFVVVNAGDDRPAQPEGLASSLAWTSERGREYTLDGGVFAAGSALQWLTQLGVLEHPKDASRLARSVKDTGGVRCLPALQGLGAPWWRARQRAVLDGLSAATIPAHIVRAVLDGIAFRVADIVRAAWTAGLSKPASLRIDGGLSECEYLVQRQADLLGLRLECGKLNEATMFGAAALAAMAAGHIGKKEVAAANAASKCYEPLLSADEIESAYQRWLAWLQHRLDESAPRI